MRGKGNLLEAFPQVRHGTRSEQQKLVQQSTYQSSTGLEAKQDVKSFLDDQERVERMLREFDLSTKYGPTSGLSRLERYQRAKKMGLDPPCWVEQAIHKYGESSDFNQHVFSAGKL